MKEISPPYKPKISSKEDIKNFDKEFTSELPLETPMDSNPLL